MSKPHKLFLLTCLFFAGYFAFGQNNYEEMRVMMRNPEGGRGPCLVFLNYSQRPFLKVKLQLPPLLNTLYYAVRDEGDEVFPPPLFHVVDAELQMNHKLSFVGGFGLRRWVYFHSHSPYQALASGIKLIAGVKYFAYNSWHSKFLRNAYLNLNFKYVHGKVFYKDASFPSGIGTYGEDTQAFILQFRFGREFYITKNFFFDISLGASAGHNRKYNTLDEYYSGDKVSELDFFRTNPRFESLRPDSYFGWGPDFCISFGWKSNSLTRQKKLSE